MIKPDVYIDLKEKDAVISEWLSAVKEQGGNATAICLEAIAYYANTGRILKIGGVTGEKKLAKKRLHLVIPEKAKAFIYLSEQAEMGKQVAVIVKTILRAGIERTEECWILTEEDMLLGRYRDSSGDKKEEEKTTGRMETTGHEEVKSFETVDDNKETGKEEQMAEEDDIFAILNVPKFG
ncbi:MAG: hypothetical protein IJN92_08695 [Lachnospiraceae bacterium]|nr:hypothetical protein [Lachnospiraceae bacterium]